jgi:CheY-like chemotaxis protein
MDTIQRSVRPAREPDDAREAADEFPQRQARQQRLFDAIRVVNDESSSQRGAAFFDTLTARLAAVLGADVAFVGQLGLDGASMDIVSVFGDGKRATPFSYCLAGTPCAQVIANRVYAHSKDVVRLFPEDTLLAEMGIHAYVGVPLRDADGRSIGILVGLFRRDLDDADFAESVLLFFAPRVALEIQQARSESVLRQRDEALHRLMDSNMVGFVSGMGIGLSIVRSLVELHGGVARAESEGAGRGARFIVELPSIAPPPQAEAPATPAPAGPRVLVVEDNDDARDMVATCLGMRGYSVAGCATGEAALDWLSREQPGVILVDIGLPGIDGYQFLRGARLVAGCAAIPALAVTALGGPEDLRRTREAGFAGHVVKPFDVDELAHRISALLVEGSPAGTRPD